MRSLQQYVDYCHISHVILVQASRRNSINSICRKYMSQTEKQPSIVDNYGYPLPPGTYKRVRKMGIRASKGVLLKCIYLVMSLLGVLLWLGVVRENSPPLTPH